ncbi:MAG: cation-translocating P-type ATPase [Burkholderiales bacterium]
MNAAAPRDPSLLTAAAVAAALSTDTIHGLSAPEAARRLAADGRNELRATKPRAAWRRLLAQFNDPLIYLLLAAVAIALTAWVIEGCAGWPVDAIVIAVVVLLNAIIGHAQETKALDVVAALARVTESGASVVRDGALQRIASAELVRGDLLLLGEGDAVAADARIVQASTLRVLESSLTGESEAVLKHLDALAAPVALGDRVNMVFNGSAVVHGHGRAIVTATGMATEMGRVAHLLDATVQRPTPLQREVAHLGRVLGVAVVVIAVIVVATLLLLAERRSAATVIEALLLGVSLAVAAVPEGLPAILSVVLALGVQRMAGRKALVKNLSSVETLGCASVIASDKTGTLTRAEMTIVRIVTASGATRVTGAGYVPEGRVEHDGAALAAGALRDEQLAVLGGGSAAGNAALQQIDGAWAIHGDPTEAAFLVAERKLGSAERRAKRFERIAEVPFSAERKMMSAIARDHEHGGELVLITKGAPDVLLGHCTRVRSGARALALDAAMRTRITQDVDALSGAALRTLAVAYRPLASGEDAHAGAALEHELIYLGSVGIIDPPRAEAAVAIGEARRAGIRVIMITGDHPRTAARIATDLGIVEPGAPALTGLDLDALDDAAFAEAVRTTSVYARVAPQHKLRIVHALQADANVVAMTGDGVNDAPALKAADIGIAMGVTGTEVAKQAARMILLDDDFATIVDAVREGRHIFDNIEKFLRYLLSSNMGEVLTVFVGVVGAGMLGLSDAGGAGGAVVVPLLATQILWINLVTDLGPALAMGVDPASADLMARPPRRPDAHAVDARMVSGVLQIGAVMAAVTLLTLDMGLPGGLIEGSGDLVTARTEAFTVLVFAQLFNCLNARSERASAFVHLFANGWLWGAIGVSAGLQIAVVELGFLNLAFGTTPLSGRQWLLCAVMASTVLGYGELRKWLARTSTTKPGR